MSPTTQHQLDEHLCYAVSNDLLGIAVDALRQGANPNAVSAQEQVPVLFLAQARRYSSEYSEMLELLLNHGADPQARDNEGNTVMHLAAMAGADGAVAQMLEAGVDPNTTNHAGHTSLQAIRDRTMLQAAARLQYAQRMPRVVLDGQLTHASLFTPDEYDDTPMDNCLTWHQFDAVVAQLQANGEPPLTKADLMRRDKTGTPLLARAIQCYAGEEVLDYLAQCGEPLTVQELMADGQGVNVIAGALMRRGQLRSFFTPDHWQDKSRDELVAALRGLPQEVRESLGNFHQLVAQKAVQDASQRSQGTGR